jgi:hypothetical protein
MESTVSVYLPLVEEILAFNDSLSIPRCPALLQWMALPYHVARNQQTYSIHGGVEITWRFW